jgi:opacity protein-like surface antigen
MADIINVNSDVLFVFWRRQEMVKKTGVGVLLSLVFVLFTCSSAVAESGYYLGFKTGNSIQDYTDVKFVNPRITAGTKSDSGTDDSALVSFQLGKTLSSSTRLEVEYANNGTAYFKRYYNDFPTVEQRIEVKSERVMFNGYYNLGGMKIATVYLSAGVGVAFNNADAVQGGSGQFDDDSSTEIAWSVGAGLSRVLTDIWSVDFGYRYVDLGDADTGISEFTPFDEHFEGELDTHEITLGMRASF